MERIVLVRTVNYTFEIEADLIVIFIAVESVSNQYKAFSIKTRQMISELIIIHDVHKQDLLLQNWCQENRDILVIIIFYHYHAKLNPDEILKIEVKEVAE